MIRNSKHLLLLLALLTLFIGSAPVSRDKMKDINTNPESDITEPDVRFPFTQALSSIEPLDYRQCFYDYSYMLKWGQITASGGGNGDRINEQGVADGIGGTAYSVMSALKRYSISSRMCMLLKRQPSTNTSRPMTYPIQVYLALHDTDMYGDRASEVFQARFLQSTSFDT